MRYTIPYMSAVSVKKNKFGLLSDGTKVHLFTVSNGKMSFSCSDYGCTVTSIILPAKGGSQVDVLLGYSSLEGFLNSDLCFGTVVGRFANRIGNASFTLDGVRYQLDKNDAGINTLHGGFDRYEKKMWKAKKVSSRFGKGVRFTRLSPDGEQGFPGNVNISVSYYLNESNTITMEYHASTDKATPLNLTNHAYFNLKGYNGGDISSHLLSMDCGHYLEVDKNLIPTGTLVPVTDTPYDFTKAKAMGKDIDSVGYGYDNCYVLSHPATTEEPVLFASVTEPESGRKMHVSTTMPGVQFYTANWIDGEKGKQGVSYVKHGAFCLETQFFPDSPNKASFPNCILRPGQDAHTVTQYSFEF